MNFPGFLTKSADGNVDLTGHRIGLYHIVRGYNDGESAEMLACRYPTLPLPLVYKTIAFYLENLVEVDAYVAEYAAELARQEKAGPRLDLNKLRRRLIAGESATIATEPPAR